MGFEDDYNPSGTVTKVTRNLLGARGIDRISITENNSTTHGYPLYDGHGNCRAILTKNGTSYGTGNWRTYDVWGSVRSGSVTGDPKSRYVASIGHVADDESSLTYMRARYYEPATGRFLSEDPAMDGANWFVYCKNDPVNKVDRTGTTYEDSHLSMLRTEWRYALGRSWQFRLPAAAFLTLWYSWLVTDIMWHYQEGNIYREAKAWRLLALLKVDFDSVQPTKGLSIKEMTAGFMAGYAACIEISVWMLIDPFDHGL